MDYCKAFHYYRIVGKIKFHGTHCHEAVNPIVLLPLKCGKNQEHKEKDLKEEIEMFKKMSVAALSVVLLAGMLPAASSDAAVATKNLQAHYRNIKVQYNGTLVPTNLEPFLVNGTTYIPLRMMAGVFNKDISWDGTTYTINVTDRTDARVAALQAEIAAKDATIKSLQQQLEDAKNNEEEEEDVDDRIDDLEESLNDDYLDYFDTFDFEDISISGDEDDIEVEIAVDLTEYPEYDDLRDRDIEELVEAIVDDIWEEFENADIEGEIVDSSDDDAKLDDFSADASEETIEVNGNEID